MGTMMSLSQLATLLDIGLVRATSMSTFPRARLLTGLLAVSVAATSIGCAEDSPSQPTTPTPTVESVSISGGRDLTEGETLTLTVSIRRSNGATETVSDGVAWTTENPSVATVAGRGEVTALAPGEARIRATLLNVAGAATLKVLPGARVTTGRVHESRPTEHIGIPGARVSVVSSDGTTETAVTDGAGNFSVRLKPGAVQVNVTAPGYDALATEVVATPGAPLSLSVVPTAQEVRISFPYIYTGVPNNPPLIQERTFRIGVHHDGELRAEYTQSYMSASAQALTCLEVRDSNNRILASSKGQYDITAAPARLNVVAGESYEVKFFLCLPGPIAAQITLAGWGGEVKHPR